MSKLAHSNQATMDDIEAASRLEVEGAHAVATETEMLKLIDDRDAAEQALSQAYYLVTGHSPEWSNNFGYAQALEEIGGAVALLNGYAKDAERWRILREDKGQEIDLSSGPGTPKRLILALEADGCERFLESGAPDYPGTLDAILDAEIAERGRTTQPPLSERQHERDKSCCTQCIGQRRSR